MSFAPGWRGTDVIMREHEQMINRGTAEKPNNIFMGTFKIEIVAIGGHGQDRTKKDGEVVDFNEGGLTTPDALAKEFVEKLQAAGIYFGGDPAASATITHWPGQESEVKDNLLTGVRTGNF